MLPFIAVAGVLTHHAIAAVRVPETSAADELLAGNAGRRRLPSALLVSLGAGLFMAGLSTGEPLFMVALVIAGLLAGLPALLRLTPPGTLTARPVLPAAVMLRGILTCTFFGVDAYVTLALEDARGLSAIAAGVVLTAATLSWTAGSWTQARNSERWPARRFVRVGFLVVVAGLALYSFTLHPDVPVWLAVPTFAIAGYGMGLAYSPLALIVLREAPRRVAGDRLERAVVDGHARDRDRDRRVGGHRGRRAARDRRGEHRASRWRSPSRAPSAWAGSRSLADCALDGRSDRAATPYRRCPIRRPRWFPADRSARLTGLVDARPAVDFGAA